MQFLTLPLQKWAFMASSSSTTALTPQQQLQEENNQLRVQIAQLQEVKKDNQALHDQFRTTTPAPQTLLPADVIGIPQNALLIDKGEQDNVHVGDVVVYKNNLVGKIAKTNAHIAIVKLLTDTSTSFTAQSVKTSATGIINSLDGNTIVFDNVVLSEKLEKNDLVVTKGDLDLHGHGFPPELVVGKIVSVDKQASNLFQAAKIESLVNIAQLRMVFVMTQ